MKKARILSGILAASLLLSACGGESTEKVETTKVNKDVVFREEVNVFSLEEGDISQIVVADDTLYVEQYIYDYNQPQARDVEEAVVYTEDDAAVEAEEAPSSWYSTALMRPSMGASTAPSR